MQNGGFMREMMGERRLRIEDNHRHLSFFASVHDYLLHFIILLAFSLLVNFFSLP